MSLRADPSSKAHPSLRMGELLVSNGEAPLRTLLGSCIGLALHSRRDGVGGLAHIVLPRSLGREGPAAKYVDTAIPELLRQIELAGTRTTHLTAKIAGGANMLGSEAVSTIGDQNLAMLRRLLLESRIPIVAEHCGGTRGRRMILYPNTGQVSIEMVGGEVVEI